MFTNKWYDTVGSQATIAKTFSLIIFVSSAVYNILSFFTESLYIEVKAPVYATRQLLTSNLELII